MKWILSLAALLLFFVPSGQAQTINAASCSSTDVQTALNAVVADNTTVNVPSCPAGVSWATTVSYTKTFSVVIQGQTTVVGTCAPGGTCTATDNTLIQTTTANTALAATATANKSLRITGFTFSFISGGVQDNGVVAVTGTTSSMRVDHNHFIHSNQIDVFVNGSAGPIFGVIDHNLMNENVLGFGVHAAEGNWSGTEGDGLYPAGLGNSSWAVASNWGTSQFVFFENNTMIWDPGGQGSSFVFDCNPGGRLVARFNKVDNFAFQTHGTGTGDPNFRGCRNIEAYGNSLNHLGTYFAVIQEEGGGYLFWGNTVSGFQAVTEEDTMRTNTITSTQSQPPNGWGYCGNQVAGQSGDSIWDQNSNTTTGYRCLDQVGAGAGDLIVGEFVGTGGTGKLNNRTGTAIWPNQVIDPVYVFANTVTGATNFWTAVEANSPVVTNRDYYQQIPNPDAGQGGTFNGTVGVGQGTLASKPATCTPAVGWWATDKGSWNTSGNSFGNGLLFVCTSSNIWTLYYTPFQYPHSLITGSTLAPPTNLKAAPIVQPFLGGFLN